MLLNSPDGREPWLDLLKSGDELEILAEHHSLYEALFAVGDRRPEILLVSGQLLRRRLDVRAVLQASKRLGVWTKVIVVADNPEEVSRALVFGADEAILFPFVREKLVHLITGLCREPKRQCDRLAEELRDAKPGLEHDLIFEATLVKILEFLFSGQLAYTGAQTFASQGIPFQLTVFDNLSSDGFWKELRETRGCDQILFLLDNRPATEIKAIEHLVKVLASTKCSFGILICRAQPCGDVFAHQGSLHITGVTVLLLSEEQIRALLAFKAAGADPTIFLQDLQAELQHLSASPPACGR